MPSFLAIDIGAESGRVVLGRYDGERLHTKDVHRFPNEPVEYAGGLHWDVPRLWLEIQRALKGMSGHRIDGIGVDTWGVDYALLGEFGELLENPYHYRDGRTAGMMEAVFQRVPAAEIYGITGIQFMPINTLFQLFAAQQKTPGLLCAARQMITVPDLFHYWLTGRAVCEYTNATTTQMIDAQSRTWATGLLDRLGLPSALPAQLVHAGSVIGKVLPTLGSEWTGTPVIAPATHDTGSAVAAIEARGDTAFLSSGTWSLVGIETEHPVLTEAARARNFTNEGGVCGTTRLLKNVMGLWMIQGCRKSLKERGEDFEYGHLMRAAMRERAFQHLINPDDSRFLRPHCMVSAVDDYCVATKQPVPASPGAYVRAILEGLALKYKTVIGELEQLTGRAIKQIRVIGGGCQNVLLNQLTADATGKRVIAGPVEATALGNIGMQMLAVGATSSLAETRRVIERSEPVEIFEPCDTERWERQAHRFKQFCEIAEVASA